MDMHAQNCMLAPKQREPILDLGAAVVDRFSFAIQYSHLVAAIVPLDANPERSGYLDKIQYCTLLYIVSKCLADDHGGPSP